MSALRFACPFGLAAFATLLSSAARADDTTGLESLLNETVITTASKAQEKGSTAPAISTILTAEDIRAYGIHSIDEAIDYLSLGAMTSNTLRAVDIGSRGVIIPNDQGDHFLLLIDGHAVNEALYGAARFERGTGVPIEMVDHIEVILGPGSVLYGSNAMLGVINIVTKRAHVFAGMHLVGESEIGKSWRVAAGAGYEPKLFGTTAEVSVALEYYRQAGPTFTVGPQYYGDDWTTGEPWRFSREGAPTGIWGGQASHSYYAQAPAGHLTFRLKNLEIGLHASTYKRASPFNHRYLNGDSDFDDPDNYELDRSLWGDVKYHAQVSRVLRLDTRVYGDTFDYQRYLNVSAHADCFFIGVGTCRHRTLGASRWVGSEVQTSWSWLGDGSFVTMLGVDGRLRFAGSVSDQFNLATGMPLETSTGNISEHDAILGAYLQQTWQPVAWLSLNAGGRYDFAERYDPRLSPRGAVSMQTWKGGTFKTIYSEAFRTPSWNEADWQSAQQIRANKLNPETVRSIEAALDQKLGTHHLMFGVFRSWWNNMIELHVLSNDEVFAAERRGELKFGTRSASQARNVSSIDNYGFNAGYEGTFGDLKYGLNVTGAIARRSVPGLESEPLAVAPRLFGNARLSYALPDRWPTLAVAAHYFAKRPADRAFDVGFEPPPYAPPQLELRGTVSGALPFMPGLSYRGSVDYSFASKGPYVIGPVQAGQSLQVFSFGNQLQKPELIPVDVLRFTFGLQYDFGGAK